VTADERAETVLATLAGFSATSVRTFARGLVLGGGPVAVLAEPVDSYADALEHDEVTGDLARLQMRRALRVLARDEVSRSGAPWPMR
jgi:hypothetical protein